MTQCQRVLKYMQDFGGITAAQAMNDLGVMRLAARISDLRRDGHSITKRMVTGRNRYNEATSFAEYKLESDGI